MGTLQQRFQNSVGSFYVWREPELYECIGGNESLSKYTITIKRRLKEIIDMLHLIAPMLTKTYFPVVHCIERAFRNLYLNYTSHF